MDFNFFVSRLKGVKTFPDGSIQAVCPAHDDSGRSLSARRGDRIPIVAYCHKKCRFEDIIRAAEFAHHRVTQ